MKKYLVVCTTCWCSLGHFLSVRWDVLFQSVKLQVLQRYDPSPEARPSVYWGRYSPGTGVGAATGSRQASRPWQVYTGARRIWPLCLKACRRDATRRTVAATRCEQLLTSRVCVCACKSFDESVVSICPSPLKLFVTAFNRISSSIIINPGLNSVHISKSVGFSTRFFSFVVPCEKSHLFAEAPLGCTAPEQVHPLGADCWLRGLQLPISWGIP